MANDPWGKKKGVYNFLKKPDEQGEYEAPSGTWTDDSGNQKSYEPTGGQNYYQNSDAEMKPLNDIISELERAQNYFDATDDRQPMFDYTSAPTGYTWSDQLGQRPSDRAALETMQTDPVLGRIMPASTWSDRIKSALKIRSAPDRQTMQEVGYSVGTSLIPFGKDLLRSAAEAGGVNISPRKLPLLNPDGSEVMSPVQTRDPLTDENLRARFVGADPNTYNRTTADNIASGVGSLIGTGVQALTGAGAVGRIPQVAQMLGKINSPAVRGVAQTVLGDQPFNILQAAQTLGDTGDVGEAAKDYAINTGISGLAGGLLNAKGLYQAAKGTEMIPKKVTPIDGIDLVDYAKPQKYTPDYNRGVTTLPGRYQIKQPGPTTVQESLTPKTLNPLDGRYQVKNTRLNELQTEYDNIVSELQNKYGTNQLRVDELQNEPMVNRLNQIANEMKTAEQQTLSDTILNASERARMSRTAGLNDRGIDILNGKTVEVPSKRVTLSDFTPSTEKFKQTKLYESLPDDKATLQSMYDDMATEASQGVKVNPQLFSTVENKLNELPDVKTQVLDKSAVEARNKAGRPSFYERMYNTWVDSASGFDNLDKAINPTGEKVSVRALAANARKSRGISSYILNDGLVDQNGQQIGKSFREIVEQVPEESRGDFELYLLHRHNIDRMQIPNAESANKIEAKIAELQNQRIKILGSDRAESTLGKDEIARLDNRIANLREKGGTMKFIEKPVFGKEVTAADSLKIAKAYETANPEFQKLANELTADGGFIDTFNREWLVNSGLLSDEQYKVMREMYPNYVPTNRFFSEMEKVKQFDSGTKKFVNNDSGIKTATGSDRDILSPIDMTMGKVDRTVRSAQYNRVGQEMVRALREEPQALKEWAEIIPSKDDVVNDINKMLDEGNLDGLTDELLKQYDKAFSNAKGSNIITVMENGVPVKVQINDPMLLKSALGLTDSSSGNLENWFRYVSRPMKNTITTYNPLFAAGNIMRDIPTGYIQGSESNPIKFLGSLISAGREIAGNSQLFKRYKALGGGEANFFKNDVTELIKSNSKWSKIKNAAGYLNFYTETLPRFAEFKTVYNKSLAEGLSETEALQKALYRSSEVTVDFSRGGDAAKSLDAFTLYFNASVQGIDKFARNTIAAPGKTIAKTIGKAALSTTIPAGVLYNFINKDDPNYKQLDTRTKDAYFLIPKSLTNIGGVLDSMGVDTDGTFWKIPKNREYGAIFGSFTERLMRYANGEKDAFKDLQAPFINNFAPANPIDSSIISPLVQVGMNTDFAGRAIVPKSMKDNRSKENQYDENTSEISKGIAAGVKAIGNTFGLDLGISPKQLDSIIKGYTGFVGQFVLPATTKSTYNDSMNPLGSAINTIGRRFTADPAYSNEILDKVYDQKDKLTRKQGDLKMNNEQLSDLEKQKLRRLNMTSEVVSDIYKQINKAPTAAEQKALRKQLNTIAEDTLKKIDEGTGFIPPQMDASVTINKQNYVIPAKDYMKYQERLETNAKGVYDYVTQNPIYSTLSDEDKEKVLDTAMTDVKAAVKNIYAKDNNISTSKDRTEEEIAASKLKGQLRDKYNVSFDDLFNYGTHQSVIIKEDPMFGKLEKAQSEGVDRNTALGMVQTWEGLKPIEGNKTVSAKQKRQALYDNSSLTEDQKQTIYKYFLFTPTDTQQQKIDKAAEQGVDPEKSMEVVRILSDLESGKVSKTTGKPTQPSKSQRTQAIYNTPGLSKQEKDILYRLYYPNG